MSKLERPLAGEAQAMQFILEGRTYDVASSSTAAISRGILGPDSHHDLIVRHDFPPDAESVRYEGVLYRTAKGAFFVHVHQTVKFPRGKPVIEDYAFTLTPEEAVRWIQDESAMVVDSTGLPLPDQA